MHLNITVDTGFLIETCIAWLVLAMFTSIWCYHYWREAPGVMGRLLSFKNGTQAQLFFHLAASVVWVLFSEQVAISDWVIPMWRRLSIGAVILSYTLIHIEIWRQRNDDG